jgi:hypothetical protein
MGNPLTHKNQVMLQDQILSIQFLDGSHIKYLPPNKSYKMLGVHITTTLDFKEHIAHVTKEVRLLAKILAKRKLSPPYKALVIEQLLKSKYHATHLGVFTNRQLTDIDRILNRALRLATCLLHNFPTEGVQKPTKEMGLGLPSGQSHPNGNGTPPQHREQRLRKGIPSLLPHTPNPNAIQPLADRGTRIQPTQTTDSQGTPRGKHHHKSTP